MDLKKLIDHYSPIVYLHSKETYFPCSIEWLLDKSTLIDFNSNTQIKQPSQKDLYDISQKYNFTDKTDGSIILSFDKQYYTGQNNLSDVPVYALSKIRDGKLYVTYIFLYAYNGSYDILGLFKIGTHEGDIEAITAEFSLEGKLLRVFFGAHGIQDGQWIDASLIEYENGHIVCYSALSGHGLYSTPGSAILLKGFATDKTNKGFKWFPKVSMLYYKDDPRFNVNTMGWSIYNGRIGGRDNIKNTDGIKGIYSKNWYHQGLNTEKNYYKPPLIITNSSLISLVEILQDLLKILLLYLIIISIKYLIEKFYKEKSSTDFILQTIIICLILLILYYSSIQINSFLFKIYQNRQKYIFPLSSSTYE